MAVKIISTLHRCHCRNRARMNIKRSGSDSFANVREADCVKESSDLDLKYNAVKTHIRKFEGIQPFPKYTLVLLKKEYCSKK